MLRKQLMLATLLAIFIVFAMQTSAQIVYGCCCDPVTFSGDLDTKAECDKLNYTLIDMPPTYPFVSCDDHCNATLAQPTPPLCGDGICQVFENITSCPQDCVSLPPTGCGSAGFTPTPTVAISIVKGEKVLKLDFGISCPFNIVEIERCESVDCTNFRTIASWPTNSYVDDDVLWDTTYNYRITVEYPTGSSDSVVVEGNPGDLECWNKADNSFCLSPHSYKEFEDYLETNGYKIFVTHSTEPFDKRIRDAFGFSRLNRAWTCDNANNLLGPDVECTGNKFCVADETGSKCITPDECELGFDPFGLYATTNSCELNRYCFLDKSYTVADQCYECKPQMDCYDYKTQDTCERDNCNAGECEWHPVIDGLGTGVCVDNQANNCRICSSPGTSGVFTGMVVSNVWEVCREEKSLALSTPLYPCFYDRDHKESKSCDEVTCSDYTEQQCAAPPSGVLLNDDNSLLVGSADSCGVNKCDYNVITGCIKNADGDDARDCPARDKACERDYFAPDTTITTSGPTGVVEDLNLHILDKTDKKSHLEDRAGKPGYKTYFCVVNASNDCSVANEFDIEVSSKKLGLSNLKLQEGNTVVGYLAEGHNILKFYSRDPSNNVEVVKSINVSACAACQGPRVLNITVQAGRFWKANRKDRGKYYTAFRKPKITIDFNEPAVIASFKLSQNGTDTPLQQLTTGMVDKHEFLPSIELLGEYKFEFDGYNSLSIYMATPGEEYIMVDPSLASVNITPADGSIVKSSSVKVTLAFTRPAELDNVTLTEEFFIDGFVRSSETKNITGLFKSKDGKTFTANLKNLRGGRNVLSIKAIAMNGLPIYAQSSFFVGTRDPDIRLVSPSFGVTAYTNFNITVETELLGDCRYLFGAPAPPDESEFAFLDRMSSIGTIHTKEGLVIPMGSTDVRPLHVFCKHDEFDLVQRSFNISLDDKPPSIVSAFAEPARISEEYYPGQNIYATTLKVQANKKSFCKHSKISSNYALMAGTFAGFKVKPKVSHAAFVNETEVKAYTYFVRCEGLNELTSQPRTINFDVDLSLALKVNSTTPRTVGTKNFSVGVVANKRVFCYIGERSDDITSCMGDCKAKYAHSQPIEVDEEGTYTYYVRCATGASERSDILEIPVFVDTSPPVMEYVDDTTLGEDPEVSWHASKARLSLLADDNQSGISHYLVTLQGRYDKDKVFENKVVPDNNGTPFFITSTETGQQFTLENKSYQFLAKAVNNVGLESEIMESDGFSVDTALQPPHCSDFEKNEDETDIDCGGRDCDSCEEGKNCDENSDCATGYCKYGECESTSCEDDAKNGVETDVDCGGRFCDACGNGKSCIANNDCDSNYCEPDTKLCEVAPLCVDGRTSQGETDVDCGGSCSPCGAGKNCIDDSDCASGLYCDENNICSSGIAGDRDSDGILDVDDDCPNTPLHEDADENGCGPSQRFSLGDEIDDAWRMNNFGCIDCADAARDADPDNDSLSNVEEYNLGTDPNNPDTDGDGWKDGVEVNERTNPLDPVSKPRSKWTTFLWVLLLLLIAAAIGYGVYMFTQYQKEAKAPHMKKPVSVSKPPSVRKEISQLRSFAKEEKKDLDWIPLRDVVEKIREEPLPKKEFERTLERLRKIARREEKRGDSLTQLRKMVSNLSDKKRRELSMKLKKLKEGKLSAKERDELFAKLKITSRYYKAHKEELERELKRYGKR